MASMVQPWSDNRGRVLDSLKSDAERGLSQTEVASRLSQFGANRLVKERLITFWGVFREEVAEPMILLLIVVGAVYFWVFREFRDGITIFVIVAALVFTEVFTEYRAKKAVTALRKLSPLTTPIWRNGEYQRVPTTEIVPGDIIMLEVGERVPADARIIDSFGLEANESALTGESLPVAKEEKVLPAETPLAERSNMVFAGTTITRGRGRAVVTATGMSSELGKITGLVLEAKEPKTPLQLAMKQLAGFLVWVAVFFSVVIPVVGILQGKPLAQMILTGLSLSFATIPEELPIVVTMVLGVGALALSRKNVLVRRLRAAETLGSVSVIATDKTGTITENRMSLIKIAADGAPKSFNPNSLAPADRQLLEIGVLTSCVSSPAVGCYDGDPTEVAIVQAADAANIAPGETQAKFRLRKEFSFDSQRKMMSVAGERDGDMFVYVKGAPEAILARSSRVSQESRQKTGADEAALLATAGDMAGEAMRVIAFAYKRIGDGLNLTQEEAERDLIFVGFAGLADPPRPGVAEALKTTRQGGIKTIVISGDHAVTVQRVASEVGIDTNQKVLTGAELERLTDQELKAKLKEVSLFARTSPEQKLRLVRLLQESGEVVAVTGDGINDAPALKIADIGIAMGETGTDVARETADMVLTDDSFNSIAAGVREGRRIFSNLKKGISYYLSVKIALVLVFLVPLLLGIPFPFAPIQIILLELFMDLAASATFVAEPIEPDIMRHPPRRREEKFINRATLTNISLASISLAGAVLVNYLLAWYSGLGPLLAQTTAFATWLVGHIFLAFAMRSQRGTLFRIGILSNRVMLIWAAAAVVFLVVVTNVPSIQAALRVTSLSLQRWLWVIGVPFVTVFWLELRKLATSQRLQTQAAGSEWDKSHIQS